MFDISAISSVADTLQTGVRDLDQRLEQIANLLMLQNTVLLAIAQESGIDITRVVIPGSNPVQTLGDYLDQLGENT